MTAFIVRRASCPGPNAGSGLRVAARTDEVLPSVVQASRSSSTCARPLEVALERLLAGARDSPCLDDETGDARFVVLQLLLATCRRGLDASRADVRDRGSQRPGAAPPRRPGRPRDRGAEGFTRQPLLLRGRGEGRQRLGGLERRLIDERRGPRSRRRGRRAKTTGGLRVHNHPATVAPMRTSRAYKPTRRFHGVGRKMLITSLEDRIIVDSLWCPTNLAVGTPLRNPPATGYPMARACRYRISSGDCPSQGSESREKRHQVRWTTTTLTRPPAAGLHSALPEIHPPFLPGYASVSAKGFSSLGSIRSDVILSDVLDSRAEPCRRP